MWGERILRVVEDWREACGKDEEERKARWKPNHSSFELAHSWHYAVRNQGSGSLAESEFPKEVRDVFDDSGYPALRGLRFDLIYSDARVEDEIKVPVPLSEKYPGDTRNDISVFGINPRSKQHVIVAVEGKNGESFGDTIEERIIKAQEKENEEWINSRLEALKEELGIEELPRNIRYQLLLRTYAAIHLARKNQAQHAVMLVHSFSQMNKHSGDYQNFASCSE